MTTAGGEKVECVQKADRFRGNRMEAALRPLEGTCLYHHNQNASVRVCSVYICVLSLCTTTIKQHI